MSLKRRPAKAKVSAKAAPAKKGGRQGIAMIAGIVAVVVVAGILLTTPGILPTGSTEDRSIAEQAAEAEQQEVQSPAQVSVDFVGFPTAAFTNTPISFIWEVQSDRELQAEDTAVYFGTSSVAAPSGPADYARSSNRVVGPVPGTFSESVTIQQAGTYYFRAHAVVDGNDVWSAERSVLVVAPSTQTTVRVVKLEADDSGFYIDDVPVSSVSARLGERIKLEIDVRKSGVYYAGLDFRSPEYDVDTGKVKPGLETDIELTVLKEGTISSYWPDTGALKAELDIEISG